MQVHLPKESRMLKYANSLQHLQITLEKTCKTFSSCAHVSRVLSHDKLSLGAKHRVRASMRVSNKTDKFKCAE